MCNAQAKGFKGSNLLLYACQYCIYVSHAATVALLFVSGTFSTQKLEIFNHKTWSLVAIVGKKRDLGILDPMIFSGKIRKNTKS